MHYPNNYCIQKYPINIPYVFHCYPQRRYNWDNYLSFEWLPNCFTTNSVMTTSYIDMHVHIYIYMKHGGVNVPQLATAKELSGHNSVHASPLTAWKF